MTSERKRLHIGSGRVYLPGWINVDMFSNSKADLFCDMMRLPYDPGSFDLIYCCHCLEHTHRNAVYAVLHHWRELLKVGGILRLAVPNFAAIVTWYVETGDLTSVTGLLYGGQNHPLNVHTIAFDKPTLTDALRKVGFGEVREWNWRKTEHAQFDDYSQAYLPAMQKDTGQLMSLNLEAVK